MIRILDDNRMGNGTRMYETPYDLYIDNIEYKKQDMYHTPFKCFNDNNTVNNIVFNKTLSPYINTRWYNGLKANNVLVDKNNPNIIYTSHYTNNKYSDTPSNWNMNSYYSTITKIDRNDKVKQYYYYANSYNKSYYYVWNENIVKFIGQSDRYLYVAIVSSYPYSSRYDESYAPDKYENSSNNYGELQTRIVSIDKTNLTQQTRTIVTLYRSYGNIKIIKETDEEIYCIAGIYDSSYNQYEIFKIDKTNNSYSSITKFYQEYDSYQRSDIVTPSDVVEIDSDNYVFYLNLMEKGEQVPSQNYYYRKNYLYKCKFTISSSSLEKTKITIDENQLPYFGVHCGKFYNEIFSFEKNGNTYLVTSTNTFYLNTTHSPEDKIISYYKVNNSIEDSPTMTLLDTIVAKDISGDFYGMLFNENEYSFLAITSTTSYIFDFSSEKIKTIDLKNRPKEIGIDLEGNYYGSNEDKSVYIYGKHKVSNIVLTPPDIPDEVTYPYQTNIKMNAYNYDGTKIKLPVKLVIVGDNVTFDDNSSNILIKNSEIDSDVSIPITITNDSIFEVYAEVERDEVI